MQKTTTHIALTSLYTNRAALTFSPKTYNYRPHTKLIDACTLADTVAYTLKRKSANR